MRRFLARVQSFLFKEGLFRWQRGMPSLLGGLNWSGAHIFSVALTPASVAAATVAEQSFVVPALPAGLPTAAGQIAVASVSKPAISNATGVANARVIDNTHIGIGYVNPTAGALTPAAETYAMKTDWFAT